MKGQEIYGPFGRAYFKKHWRDNKIGSLMRHVNIVVAYEFIIWPKYLEQTLVNWNF